MKFLLLITCFWIYSFACTGDCLQCHPVLEKSIEKPHHKILKKCVDCHTKVPEGMSECGGDCFACHSQNKLIKTELEEHKQLASCKECHINKEDFLQLKSFDNNSNLLDLMENK